MKIILSPIASNYTTTVVISGLIIIVDDTIIDLSVIPDGGYAEPDDNSPFIGRVTRDTATVKYFYDSTKAVPKQSTNWNDYTFEVIDGLVPCPIKWKV
jgi:hypothetical protein